MYYTYICHTVCQFKVWLNRVLMVLHVQNVLVTTRLYCFSEITPGTTQNLTHFIMSGKEILKALHFLPNQTVVMVLTLRIQHVIHYHYTATRARYRITLLLSLNQGWSRVICHFLTLIMPHTRKSLFILLEV